MDLDFLEALEQGKVEAENYDRNLSEVTNIFNSVEYSLQRFLSDTSVRLTQKLETHTNGVITGLLNFRKSNDDYTGYTLMQVGKLEESEATGEPVVLSSDTIFKYKFGEKVYPVEIQYDETKILCNDSDALVKIIKNILANGSTVKLLLKL